MEKTASVSADVDSVERNVQELGPGPDGGAVTTSDERLRELGYKSEFRRDMSLFGVLGISFCAIGILTGMSSAFQTGLFSGGPLGLFWGWNVRRVFASFHCETDLKGSRATDLQLLHAAHRAVFGGDLQCLVSDYAIWVGVCVSSRVVTVLRWVDCTSGSAR